MPNPYNLHVDISQKISDRAVKRCSLVGLALTASPPLLAQIQGRQTGSVLEMISFYNGVVVFRINGKPNRVGHLCSNWPSVNQHHQWWLNPFWLICWRRSRWANKPLSTAAALARTGVIPKPYWHCRPCDDHRSIQNGGTSHGGRTRLAIVCLAAGGGDDVFHS